MLFQKLISFKILLYFAPIMLYRLILAYLFLKIVESSCPNGGIELQSTCLYFNITEHRFDKADAACAMGGGHLVAIHDSFANTAIQDYAVNYFSESTDTDFWIGGQKDDNSSWTWTDGSNFDYNDWNKGEPSSIDGFNCAALSVIDGYWSAQMCSKAKPFVCAVPIFPDTGSTMTIQ